MLDLALANDILNSLKNPVLVANTDHTIIYMNNAAIAHYEEGESLLGQSVLDCHNEQSRQMMLEIFEAMQAGEEERQITDNKEHRIFMRAVRGQEGQLIGYFERYEPPTK
jgi:nitrogen-specific signal transduction histidine kinase